MYAGLKKELERIVMEPKFKLEYSSRGDIKQRYETFTVYNNGVAIITVTKETTDNCRWAYRLNIGPFDYTKIAQSRDEMQHIYDLCVARRKFEHTPQNVAMMNYLHRHR